MTEKAKKFKIPVNTIQPVNRRIFVIEKPADEIIRPESKIIELRQVTVQRGDDTVNINVERYFVVDVANDCPLTVKDGEGKERKLQRGDEVYIFYPETALRYEKVLVFDHDAEKVFVSFDPSELAAVKPDTGIRYL